MDKKLFLRRVAILLALVVGILQMQIGGAVTVTSYDFAASTQSIDGDLLGGGSASTSGNASTNGVLGSTASAASSSSSGGSKDFSAGGIGGNRAHRDSFIRKTFTGLVTGTYFVTITVDVASITTPTSVGAPGSLDMLSTAAGTTRCTPGAVPPPAATCVPGQYVPLTNSAAYSLVQLGGSVVTTTSGIGNSCANNACGAKATYLSSDGYAFNEIQVGTETLTLSFTLASPGTAIVELHLIAEAWAAGNASSATSAINVDVTSIELT